MKNQLSSLQHRQTILKIMIFTLVTAVIWVGLTLFRTQQKTEISPELQKLAIPLNPNLNLGALTRIEAKKEYTEQDLSDFPVYSLVIDRGTGEKVVVFNASDKSRSNQAAQAQQKAVAEEEATAASPSPSVAPTQETQPITGEPDPFFIPPLSDPTQTASPGAQL